MNFKSLVLSSDWQELKTYLLGELVYRPLDIDTTNKTIEEIALEVKASQIAAEKIKKIIQDIQFKGAKKEIKEEIYT